MLFSNYIQAPAEVYRERMWTDRECKLFYAKERQCHCSPTDLMDLWLVAPCCEDCAQNEIGYSGQMPDIVADGWEVDVLIELGGATLYLIESSLSSNPDYGPSCKRCFKTLRPWEGDDLHILRYHLEEHYSIPMEAPGQNPSERLRQLILQAYGHSCFNCATSNGYLRLIMSGHEVEVATQHLEISSLCANHAIMKKGIRFQQV